MATFSHLSSSLPHFNSQQIVIHRISKCPPCLSLQFPTITAIASSAKVYTAQPPPMPISHYDVLGLSACATIQEIKLAYRSLVRKCHPDVVIFASCAELSTDKFLIVHEAYTTLSDPVKRAEYDRRLPAMGFTGRLPPLKYRYSAKFGCRAWETDQCW